MKIKIGDIYIRHSDAQICMVKWVGRASVVLEFNEDGLILTNIFALEKAYSKRESKPTQ